MPGYVNVGDVAKEVDFSVNVLVSGTETEKLVTDGWVNVGGVAKRFYARLGITGSSALNIGQGTATIRITLNRAVADQTVRVRHREVGTSLWTTSTPKATSTVNVDFSLITLKQFTRYEFQTESSVNPNEWSASQTFLTDFVITYGTPGSATFTMPAMTDYGYPTTLSVVLRGGGNGTSGTSGSSSYAGRPISWRINGDRSADGRTPPSTFTSVRRTIRTATSGGQGTAGGSTSFIPSSLGSAAAGSSRTVNIAVSPGTVLRFTIGSGGTGGAAGRGAGREVLSGVSLRTSVWIGTQFAANGSRGSDGLDGSVTITHS